MPFVLRRTRAVLRKFNPGQEYWVDARIVVHEDERYSLITYWKNPELDGVWEFKYEVSYECMLSMLHEGLLKRDGHTTEGLIVYRLSEKGKERLG